MLLIKYNYYLWIILGSSVITGITTGTLKVITMTTLVGSFFGPFVIVTF